MKYERKEKVGTDSFMFVIYTSEDIFEQTLLRVVQIVLGVFCRALRVGGLNVSPDGRVNS